MEGAKLAMEELAAPGMDNPVRKYAAARQALYDQGKKIELLVGYEPSFRFLPSGGNSSMVRAKAKKTKAYSLPV